VCLVLLLAIAARSPLHASFQGRNPNIPVEDMTRKADVIGVATILS
jgi:hypothetical protein